jgi:hypothetical protein
MSKRNYPLKGQSEAVAKRALWLAWKASKLGGMGVMQHNPTATADDVWRNALGREDYPHLFLSTDKGPGLLIRADYVFGHMMKLSFRVTSDTILYPDKDSPLNSGYQSWCGRYPTYDALLDAAEKSLRDDAAKEAAEYGVKKNTEDGAQT